MLLSRIPGTELDFSSTINRLLRGGTVKNGSPTGKYKEEKNTTIMLAPLPMSLQSIGCNSKIPEYKKDTEAQTYRIYNHIEKAFLLETIHHNRHNLAGLRQNRAIESHQGKDKQKTNQ